MKSKRGDIIGAADAWREAVHYRRNVAAAPQLSGPYKYASLARALTNLQEAQLAADDVAGTEESGQESATIKQAIAQP